MMTDPDNVLAVFRMARGALVQCACNADPLKDGCYRCVYAYRRSREMASTSRDTAVAVLNTILEQAEDLQVVDGLRSVKVNPVLESELEARFIEALRRVEVDAGPVRVREDIVGGKPGYVLTTAGRTWYMEAQVELGESDGVEVASRPDFVIRPARESPDQSPIAVFTRLLGLFQPVDMQSAVLKRELADAVARELPSMTRAAIGELPEETAFAGRGKWRGTPPHFAQVFLALPLTAVEPPEPDKLIAAVHLEDAARSADRDYRRAWNGVLRLYGVAGASASAGGRRGRGSRRSPAHQYAGHLRAAQTPGVAASRCAGGHGGGSARDSGRSGPGGDGAAAPCRSVRTSGSR